jgi:alkane 1-monooxygenase
MIAAMTSWARYRFALAWAMPLTVGAAAAVLPAVAWAAALGIQLALAGAELIPRWRHSPPADKARPWYRWCIVAQVPLQAALLAWALWLVVHGDFGAIELLALGVAVGTVTGSQGITFAHELGHSRSKADRLLGWVLMSSVLYAHFMVEHYRGHHVRAATREDPASARWGESFWRFLPRTLFGSLASAWSLEARQLKALCKGWHHSPLAWATAGQTLWLVVLWRWLGADALGFWLAQAAHAVFLLEAVNYIEHYGLERRRIGGRFEPFAVQHAWNADHALTNCLIANLQRHSDHHMHAWKPYPALDALPGPQLPTGYAGCLFLALVPPLWFALMHRRLRSFALADA